MKVYQLITRDEGITNPKRSVFGVTLALRWGDVAHPTGEGNWFDKPYFITALRFFSYFPLPWITWNLFGWRGYLGAKIYGADSPTYVSWLKPEEVYEGSQAIHFSGRLFIKD